MEKPRITALTVTYGQRWALLQEVLRALQALPEVERILVVDNGCHPPLAAQVAASSWAAHPPIAVLRLEDNQGSAGGFAAGLQAASQDQPDWIYLVDDDNAPAPDALTQLLAHHGRHPQANLALLSHRPKSSPQFNQLLAGLDPRTFYGRTDNFLGFSLWHLWRNRRRKRAFATSPPAPKSWVSIDYAPWGGLLLSRELIAAIGWPRADFFLYAEDYEYTHRIKARGGDIHLVGASIVTDLEASWSRDASHQRWISLPILEESGWRGYYATRNHLFFNFHALVRSRWRFALNGLAYLIILVLVAWRKGRWQQLQLFWVALRDGLRGQLGRNPTIEARFSPPPTKTPEQ